MSLPLYQKIEIGLLTIAVLRLAYMAYQLWIWRDK